MLLLIYILLKKTNISNKYELSNKTHSTSETNKSFNHCDLEWGFKIKHAVSRRPKTLTRMKAKLH